MNAATQRSIFDADFVHTDVCEQNHGGNSESRLAHDSIVATKVRLREKVLAFIRERGSVGATCDEIEQGLQMSHQTASARASELRNNGAVMVIGRRSTRSGRSAAVLCVELN